MYACYISGWLPASYYLHRMLAAHVSRCLRSFTNDCSCCARPMPENTIWTSVASRKLGILAVGGNVSRCSSLDSAYPKGKSSFILAVSWHLLVISWWISSSSPGPRRCRPSCGRPGRSARRGNMGVNAGKNRWQVVAVCILPNNSSTLHASYIVRTYVHTSIHKYIHTRIHTNTRAFTLALAVTAASSTSTSTSHMYMYIALCYSAPTQPSAPKDLLKSSMYAGATSVGNHRASDAGPAACEICVKLTVWCLGLRLSFATVQDTCD